MSDDERDEVVNLLRDQTTVGRLTLTEFEERLDDVYRARTRADLEHALRELPVAPPLSATAVDAAVSDAEVRAHYRRRVRKELSEFAMPNIVCNTIWFIGDGSYWWPGWVLLGTGVGLFGSMIRGFDPDEERERILRKRRSSAMAEIESDARTRHH